MSKNSFLTSHEIYCVSVTRLFIARTYTMGVVGFSPEVKRPECESDHSQPFSAEIKNGGTIPPLLHTTSWCGA
jgi:hypothetical protein